VYLCQGCGGRYGRFHKKAVVVDSRIAYVGGANLTDQAVNYNGELVVRLLGPPVAETLTELEQCLSKLSTARGIA
jgi:phosphatidylserine/phosphatidylglycerophosphate/cardiolipin synthase-like enzyme